MLRLLLWSGQLHWRNGRLTILSNETYRVTSLTSVASLVLRSCHAAVSLVHNGWSINYNGVSRNWDCGVPNFWKVVGSSEHPERSTRVLFLGQWCKSAWAIYAAIYHSISKAGVQQPIILDLLYPLKVQPALMDLNLLCMADYFYGNKNFLLAFYRPAILCC